MEIEKLLRFLVDKGGSDLHLKVNRPPLLRLKGDLIASDLPVISKEDMNHLLSSVLTEMQREKLAADKELDFSYLVEGLARFRGNIFYQMNNVGAVFRVIPVKIKTLDDLNMPEVIKDILQRNQGVVLATGPTGSGKSTTLAAMVDHINRTKRKHIITIEDPLEFVHADKLCTINQREVGSDTKSFSEALRRALRQDPDIILVGEMRDPETISIAMTAAETGHLVFSTLHTNDAKQSIDRIIDTFPPEQQHQVRVQLAMTLWATISQRLVETADGQGRRAVMEIMINTPTIRKLIEEGNTGRIDKAIADSASLYKMQTQNQHLFELVQKGLITEQAALGISTNSNDLKIMLKTRMPTAERPEQTKLESKEPETQAAKPSFGKRPSRFGKN